MTNYWRSRVQNLLPTAICWFVLGRFEFNSSTALCSNTGFLIVYVLSAIFVYLFIYLFIHSFIYLFTVSPISTTVINTLNYLFIIDDKVINCRFDLAFYHYLVSYYTTCVRHSSDKIAKCEFTSLHWSIIYLYLFIFYYYYWHFHKAIFTNT